MMQVDSWRDFKLQLVSQSPWLQSFIDTAEEQAIATLKTRISSNPYEPLLIEPLLEDISSALDRCLAYRREAYDLDIAAVKAATDYELFLANSKTEQELEINALGIPQLEAEEHGFRNSSDAYGSQGAESALELGSQTHDKTLHSSASAGKTLAHKQQELITKRWETIRNYQEAYNMRHTSPGNSHNYAERHNRLVELLSDEVCRIL